MSEVIELAQKLIACPSVTPEDANCQTILKDELKSLGFKIKDLPFGDVKNFWAIHGNHKPTFVFVGHTDVVPTGPLNLWNDSPFDPKIHKGYLYGRGSADMKGNIAAMMIACKNFLKKNPKFAGSIAWLITGDEEGPSIDGTAKVVEYLKSKNQSIDACLVGEPTSEKKLGDTLKIGRRGTLSAAIKIIGKQGHIAYPHLADNPIHRAISALKELIQTEWDQGADFFSATSLQFSNIHAGTGAGNVIPGHLELHCNFRYSPAVTAEQLKDRFEKILAKDKLKYEIHWHHSGEAFLTKPEKFVAICERSIEKVMGFKPKLSTSGGTSDARFIAPLGCEIVELGISNETIHQINECVSVADLEKLVLIYELILQEFLTIL